MKKYVNKYEFSGVMKQQTNWQIDLIDKLFDDLESYELNSGEDLDFDPVAIRCEYAQYDSLDDFNDQNSTEYKNLDELIDNHHTVLISDINTKILVSQWSMYD
tara:strand:+ start:196 stop:504 length:309 start_codon:yes stop_codon:yes gene_type:complete